jgi:two-component system chemotaxis sensor kinase CheA
MKGNDRESAFTETFLEEAAELLAGLESTLIDLETTPGDKELLSSAFRAIHTIKGSAAMFGFDEVAGFTHEIESILASVRDGAIPFSKTIADYTLGARDLIREMLDPGKTTEGLSARAAAFAAEFRGAAGLSKPEARNAEADAEKRAKAAGTTCAPAKKRTYRITVTPDRKILARGTDPIRLIRELRDLGEAACIPNCDAVPRLSDLRAEECYVSWEVFLTTDALENDIRDLFVFVEDACEVRIAPLDSVIDTQDGDAKRLGEILVEDGKIDGASLQRFLASRKRLGESLVDERLVSKTDVKVALETQNQIQRATREKRAELSLGTMRVKSEKLDGLMALVGELVTVQARVREAASRHDDDDDLLSAAEQFGRLADELRSNAMDIRMVSVGATFASFRRMVRDLSAQLGKEVALEIRGEDTELDKTIIEKLQDPLLHIIRNSLDHGIETPEERTRNGKPAAGTIRLNAEHKGTFVSITVADDGKGFNRAAIRRKAEEKGLIAPGESASDQDLLKLVFLPGFSTNATVTSVSGRGVGMDVVKRQMDSIGGSVSIESAEGSGTTISLSIPLTLAIIDGLLVRVAGEFFVVPLSCVDGCFELAREGHRSGTHVALYQGHQLPCIDLRAFFGVRGQAPARAQTVVINVQGAQYGLITDIILGNTQAVVKPLGAAYRNAQGLSGATIRGDGSVALILDAERIVN